jgi:hypothetical protein
LENVNNAEDLLSSEFANRGANEENIDIMSREEVVTAAQKRKDKLTPELIEAQ